MAAGHICKRIDLNEHLIRDKEATFILRVKGDSMTGIGIYEGDEFWFTALSTPGTATSCSQCFLGGITQKQRLAMAA